MSTGRRADVQLGSWQAYVRDPYPLRLPLVLLLEGRWVHSMRRGGLQETDGIVNHQSQRRSGADDSSNKNPCKPIRDLLGDIVKTIAHTVDGSNPHTTLATQIRLHAKDVIIAFPL